MVKGIENELKSNALGRRRGLENRSNLDADAHRKSMHKLMDFEVKIEENREKNGSPNNAFFDHVFLSISGGFGKGLGRVWGGLGKVLGMKFSSHWRNEGRPADCALRSAAPPGTSVLDWDVKFFFYLLASKVFT